MTDKKVLTMQDISCLGQCSLTVALPIISACGVETCVLPSAVLSTHTGGFTGYTFRDLTEDIPKIMKHWESEGISFDAFYTGYLGSVLQIDYVKSIKKKLLTPDAKLIVDPAMADNGKLYVGFNMEFVDNMRSLCAQADIALPNITEAALLTKNEYIEGRHTREYIERLLDDMLKLGAGCIVLKGIADIDGKLGVAVRKVDSNTEYYYTDKIDRMSHGTGDAYASAFVGSIMQGKSYIQAASIAADFVVESIKATLDDPKHTYGVKFERALPLLTEALNHSAAE